MTVLNFILREDLVGVVADTVVSDPADMAPMFFTTKVYPVPHWKGLICGTGIMNVITEWAFTAMTSILARDIVHLDDYAPDALRSLYAKFKAQFGEVGTVTLYHFGWDATASRFVGFAYRSTSNFESEQLPYGIGLKPDPELPPEEVNIVNFPVDVVAMAKLQKAKDAVKPMEKQVGIGGELFAYLMRCGDQGIYMNIDQCGEFDDFEHAYQTACDRLPSNHG